MWWLGWNLVYLCLLALQCATDVDAAPSDAGAVAETESVRLVMDTIETANQALDLYDRIMERIIPWKKFNETLVQLENHRIKYSAESAELIGEIKTHMLDGIGAYFTASQNIYEWAGSVASSFTSYISLLKDQDDRQATAQKNVLIEMLDSGVQKMAAAQDELGKSSSSFNSVFGRLGALQSRFEHESNDKIAEYNNEIKNIRRDSYILGGMFGGIQGLIVAPKVTESKYIFQIKREMIAFKQFYDNLSAKIELAIQNIHDTKKILKMEIQHISNLKAQTEETEMFVNLDDVSDLRDTVIDSAQELIAKCMEYRKRHIENTEIV